MAWSMYQVARTSGCGGGDGDCSWAACGLVSPISSLKIYFQDLASNTLLPSSPHTAAELGLGEELPLILPSMFTLTGPCPFLGRPPSSSPPPTEPAAPGAPTPSSFNAYRSLAIYSFVFSIRLRHISEELRPVTKCFRSTREESEPLSSGNAYPSHCTECIGNLFLIFFSHIKPWNDLS